VSQLGSNLDRLGAQERAITSSLIAWRTPLHHWAWTSARGRLGPPGWLAPVGVLVVACVLRAFQLGSQSLWLDELEQGTVARLPLGQMLASLRSSAGDSPLDDFGIRLVTLPFAHPGTVETRLWAFLVGSAAVLVVSLATQEAFQSRTAGIVAGLTLAFMPLAVFYSQEARPYALVMFSAAFNLWLFARALRVGRWGWVWFGFSVALALNTHYYLALLVIGEFVTLVILRKAWGCTSVVVGGIADLPWLVYALPHQLLRTHDYAPPAPLTPIALFHAWRDVLSPTAETGIVLVGLSLLTAGIATALYRRSPTALVAAFACVVAIPFAWTIDVHGNFYFSVRQVIFVLPSLALLAGGASTSIDRKGVTVVMAIWLLLQEPGLRLVYAGDLMPKEDWSATAAFVEAHIHSDSVIYSWVGAPNSFGVAYYLPQLEPRCRWIASPIDQFVTQPLNQDDVIVLSRDLARTGYDTGTVSDYLQGQGWHSQVFSRGLGLWVFWR
jgi:mannosyltransferase